jgi:hypothetical protein
MGLCQFVVFPAMGAWRKNTTIIVSHETVFLVFYRPVVMARWLRHHGA